MKIENFFDKGYYINLDRRTDRRQHFEQEISKIGLRHFFERFSGHDNLYEFKSDDILHKHHWCGSSYHRLFKIIAEKNIQKVIVFEDDIIFYNEGSKPALQIIEEALDDIQNIPDWDIIYFGGHPCEPVYKITENISTPKFMLGMHAVGYSRRAIETMLTYKPFEDSAIDGWLSSRANLKKYMTNFLAIAQADGTSDLDASGKSVGLNDFVRKYKTLTFTDNIT